MSSPDPSAPGPSLESVFDETTPDLRGWSQLLERSGELPIRRRSGFLGWLIYSAKRLLRPFVKSPQNEHWEFQKRYNLAVQQFLTSHSENLESTHRELSKALGVLGTDLQSVQTDLVRDLQEHLERHRAHEERLIHLEGFKREGFDDVMEHMDAAASLLDQKLDRYRRESQTMWGKLGGLLALAESEAPESITRAANEQNYVEFEQRFRGTESEIGVRLSRYLGYLKGKPRVLDLGCGRGEALQILSENRVECYGIDASAEMIRICRDKGLEAKEADILEELASLPPGSLGGIVSFHVIEHLPAETLSRLVHLAWRALAPGGVLVLETPNPLALVVGARNFWLDPTHLRPVHPDGLNLLFRQAGFSDVEMIPLHPFDSHELLPELSIDGLTEQTRDLAVQILHLRDRLNDILFGHQDYGMVGFKLNATPTEGRNPAHGL
jgi:SAM-dependent methyltransferase